MAKGMAWFEDANAPVLAIADENSTSEFVRVLVLPSRFKGQATLTLLNEEDKQKPRLQKNTRYFDHPLAL